MRGKVTETYDVLKLTMESGVGYQTYLDPTLKHDRVAHPQ